MGEAARFSNVFAPVFQKAAETATEEKKTILEQIENLRDQRQRIDNELEQLQQQMASLDEAITLGLTHAARDAGLKLDLNRPMNGSATSARGGSSTGVSAEAIKAVMTKMPAGRKNALTFGSIRKAVAMSDEKQVASALKRLVSIDKIKTIGQRRAKRYYIGP